ncbi:MAG TPA: hypothetical protein VGU67_07515 [Edaphobacter sp.]|nr:hypothetical protein [Edaphobacter sp.]
MKFAKVVFWAAGIWGLLILTPLYFMFDLIGRQTPPPINHPQFYFGFVGVGLVWQIAFFVIAREPVRFRPMMIPSVLEKLSYVVMLIVLHLQGRLDAGQMFFCGTDLVLGLLFIAAFVKTPKQGQAA